jgi:hypothetical protein
MHSLQDRKFTFLTTTVKKSASQVIHWVETGAISQQRLVSAKFKPMSMVFKLALGSNKILEVN